MAPSSLAARLRLFMVMGGLALWAVLCLVWVGILWLVTVPFSRVRARRRAHRVGIWARGTRRVLRVRIRVEGEVPKAPFLLVSNHLGYLDVPVLASVAPCRFVSKHEVAGWPVAGWLARVGGTLFIDRTSGRDAVRTLKELQEAIEVGDSMVIFAESKTSMGERVLPFRSALLDWAARTGFPVHYATLHYRTPAFSPPAHDAVCWHSDAPLSTHFPRLVTLPWIEATVRFGPEALTDSDRRSLAQRLHEAASRQFIPVVEPVPPTEAGEPHT
jgi:1-acyl-sn-glycerol-3-phosphate acyltransferase